ncbi:MAG: SH3 domain-containing protein [Rickettsia sp.]|nr:SH3 domain-containing protein [Rickettsia sp.]
MLGLILEPLFLVTEAQYKISKNNANIFMGIKKNKVNSRSGPGKEYPIINIYVKKGEPVKILEYQNEWVKIQDFDKDEGWIYKNLLSRKHYVIVNTDTKLGVLTNKKIDSKIKFYIEPKARCRLEKSFNNWCKIECKSHTGWVMKDKLWGISDNNLKISPSNKK